MNTSLTRMVTLCAALIMSGCGGDDDDDSQRSDEAEKRPDSGTDAPSDREKYEDKKDASTASDAKTGSGQAGSTAANGCDLTCAQPARCERQDGKPKCVCPGGYDDVKGDGSECKDKDECANAEGNDCDKNARCENEPGGFKCSCKGPAYTGDGKSCRCADGFEEAGGACLAPDGKACEDNLDCKNEHCVGGTCCAQACSSPTEECTTDDGATCEDGRTCKYATAKDGTACDDANACTAGSTCEGGKCKLGTKPESCDDQNPCTDDSCDPVIGCKNQNNSAGCDDKSACTENDRCINGTCTSESQRDCSAENDACNSGICDPKDGACKKQPVADGKACDDADRCTKADMCMAGACRGGNACGPNATACTAAEPANSCMCADTYHESNGRCVPDNDECEAAPCGANADCFDPSNTTGDATCTCQSGYRGDGKTCVLIAPCANNPCGEGRGTCTEGAPGTHTCACSAGFTAVSGTCVCDLSGTFAVKTEYDMSWPTADNIEGGRASSTTWSLQRHSYGPDGTLAVEIIHCGDSDIDICGTGVGALVPQEAYAQYVPPAVWDKPGLPTVLVTTNIPSPVPNGKFQLPHFSVLQGISLADPMGPWPASLRDVQGSSVFDGSAVNDARWLDTDNDGVYGLTTYTVGPQGVSTDDPAIAPLTAYGTRSPVCPRGNESAQRLAYNYPPGAEGISIRRIKRFYSANRTISGYDGALNGCDEIKGTVTGPDDGTPHFDARIGGCLRVNGDSESACSTTLVDALDATSQNSNEVHPSPFVMKRVSDATTCKEVRAMTF